MSKKSNITQVHIGRNGKHKKKKKFLLNYDKRYRPCRNCGKHIKFPKIFCNLDCGEAYYK